MKRLGVFLSASPSQGGMFQYSQLILESVSRLHASDFFITAAYTDRVWETILAHNGVTGVNLGSGSSLNSVGTLLLAIGAPIEIWLQVSSRYSQVVRAIAAQNCDLWIFPRQDSWASILPVTSLVALHDLMHRYEGHFPEVGSYGRRWNRDKYLRRSCEMSAGVLVDSQVGKAHVQDSYGILSDKIFVLPYPYGRPNSNQNSGRLRVIPDLPRKFLFYPAQFWQHKNHIRLVKAIARLRQRFPDIKLLLAGAALKRYAEVSALVYRLGLCDNVHFLGYVPDSVMPELYVRARALVFPTFFGPTNLPPLEAMSFGCPVASSDVYAMREQLGDAALYFNPNSIDSMVESIGRLWSDDGLCMRLSQEGKRRAEKWTVCTFGDRLHSIIRQLTNSAVSRCEELQPQLG